MMGDRDEIRPDGLLDARRRMGPGDGYADDEDDVIGHGMPEIPGAGDGFAAARERAYDAVGHIRFDGQQTRPDIAERAVEAAAGKRDLFPAGSAG